MQFVQAPCYATMDKLSDFNDIFNRRKNVFHLSEFSAESENPITEYKISDYKSINIVTLNYCKRWG